MFWIDDTNQRSICVSNVVMLNYVAIDKNRLISCKQIQSVISDKTYCFWSTQRQTVSRINYFMSYVSTWAISDTSEAKMFRFS